MDEIECLERGEAWMDEGLRQYFLRREGMDVWRQEESFASKVSRAVRALETERGWAAPGWMVLHRDEAQSEPVKMEWENVGRTR
jgi:hypothetical protein